MRLAEVGEADCNASSKHGGQTADFQHWLPTFMAAAKDFFQNPKKYESKLVADDIATDSEEEQEVEEDEGNGVMDLEDMGNVMNKVNKQKRANDKSLKKEMITPELRKALTKQGYRLIGSHSGVKLCRWTKSMLRGRGGCYKHTFYGIESHRCMETTPSLACANKCVFCWRC